QGQTADAAVAVDEGEEIAPLWEPSKERDRKSVEQLLLERGLISEEQLAQAKQVAGQTPGKSIAQILQTMNAASEVQFLEALAETLELDFERPEGNAVEAQAFELLPVDYIRKHLALPLRIVGKQLVLAM